jgi:hypothetical protein
MWTITELQREIGLTGLAMIFVLNRKFRDIAEVNKIRVFGNGGLAAG